ncbi:MAG TPA: HD domain-containing phosphohydrolase [Pyrinomonadaceae bacterium]|nr:HD domain-containing phosphohydrolase [Pyrinomonadaceae bacterium]
MATTHIDFGKEARLTGEAFVRMASATDDFERYAHPHATRIAALADGLARMFHLARHDRSSLRLAALAHDLGEVTMERDYIKRAGPLSDDERLDLARHPLIGEREAARAGADRGAQLLIRWHQEWWSGGGYPDALRREQIPLAARILRVADAYAALTDDRPFRNALTEEDARKHLIDWAGLEFDPRIVQAFLSLGPLEELSSYAKKSREPGVWSRESKAEAESEEKPAHDDVPDSAAEPSSDDSSTDSANLATADSADKSSADSLSFDSRLQTLDS